MTPQPPTPGALRAAEAIAETFVLTKHTVGLFPTRSEMAEIIDAETGAGALASELKDLCDVASTEDLPRSVRNQAHKARAALKAWEEGRR